MSLTTLSDIQAEVARYLWDRDDLTAMITDFIAMTEARLNNTLRVSQMETSASITLTSGAGSLPSDYLSWRRVLTQDNPVRVLVWAEPNWAEDTYQGQTSADLSNHFTILGSTITTYPPSSSNLTLRYYTKIPALASNTSGNWVTSRDPRLYIYGAMVEASPFLDDDERIMTWGAMFKAAVEELKQSDKMARYAKSTMRITGKTP